MRTVDFSENRIGRAKSAEKLRYLWKLDDPEWMKIRKEQGRHLVKDVLSEGNSAKTIKEYMRYFIYGEHTAYIDKISVMFLTPYTSAESARSVFESGLFGHSERRELFERFVTVAPIYYKGMPWLSDHIKYFAAGVLGNQYEVIEELTKGRNHVITPNPSRWCRSYIGGLKKRLRDPSKYQGLEHCIPYFVSMLPHATFPKDRQRCGMEEFMPLVDEVLGSNDADEETLEVARALKFREKEIRANWAVNASLDQVQ